MGAGRALAQPVEVSEWVLEPPLDESFEVPWGYPHLSKSWRPNPDGFKILQERSDKGETGQNGKRFTGLN